MSYLAFPWEQFAILLRSLSLSGAAGNVAAWVLFAAAGGSPLAAWGLLVRRGKGSKVDLLLPVLSMTLSAGLWFLINPAYLGAHLRFPMEMEEMGKAVFALAIDSVLLTWLILRFLKSCERMERKRLLRGLELLLGFYIALSAAAVLLKGGGELAAELKAVGGNLSAAGDGLLPGGGSEWLPPAGGWLPGAGDGIVGARSVWLSRFVLALQAVSCYLPGLLKLVLCGAVIGFLHSCEQDSFHERSVKAAERLKRWSAYFLGAILGANICVNLLQLLLAGYIYGSRYLLVFPLEEILVMLGVTMLSRFWLEGKELKDDNALFI